MLFRLRIDISTLTRPQIRRLRGWLLVAIVGVMFMQSVLTALLVFSIDNPLTFQESYAKSEQTVSPVSYTHLDVYKRQSKPFADGYAKMFKVEHIHNDKI